MPLKETSARSRAGSRCALSSSPGAGVLRTTDYREAKQPLRDLDMRQQREVVRGLRDGGSSVDDLAGFQPISEGRRQENVVETHVRVPGGESEAPALGVEDAIAVHVIG